MMKHRTWLTVCLCAVVLVSSAGCEPLRKKFTRQKKKGDTSKEIIPVLEPVEYPVPHHGAKEDYAQHYSLFRVWLSDFMTNYGSALNERKLVSDLDASLKELDEMAKLLKTPAQEDLAKVKAQLEYIRREYDKSSAAFRNRARIDSELRSIDSTMRKKFKPELLNDQFDQ
jgi:hypothetical protein